MKKSDQLQQQVLVLMEMYSYSALSNVLVLVLSHHQCTHTRTLLMKMYSAPGLIYGFVCNFVGLTDFCYQSCKCAPPKDDMYDVNLAG